MKILIILLFCQFAHGANLDEIFEQFYFSNKISSRHCGQNINNFVKELERNNIETSNVKVLEITAPGNGWGFGNVVALNSRWGKELDGHRVQNWGFHVVAVIENRVYDFSFNTFPIAPDFETYIEQMFVAQNPILLYGSSFRISGQGPGFTPEISKELLHNYKFRVVD